MLLAPGTGVILGLGLPLRGHILALPCKGASWWPEPMAPSEVSKVQWLSCRIKHRYMYLLTQLIFKMALAFSELNSIVSSFYLDC